MFIWKIKWEIGLESDLLNTKLRNTWKNEKRSIEYLILWCNLNDIECKCGKG